MSDRTEHIVRVVPVRRPIYRWQCDFCDAWGTHGPRGRPMAEAMQAARSHLADNPDDHFVTIVRILRWVESVHD